MNRIYLDNAATTPVSKRVLDKMLPYFTEHFGNASSIYETGRDARKAVDTARRQAAAAINAKPQEIYFTAGGSESDNWAIKGAAFARRNKGNHIITSAVEAPVRCTRRASCSSTPRKLRRLCAPAPKLS